MTKSDGNPWPPARKLRWWPLGVIALGLVAGGIKIHIIDQETPFQARNLATGGLLAGGAAAVLLWWLILSRARWRHRWIGLLGVAILLGGFGALFRIRGVSGDLVPILEPRWKAGTGPATPSAVAVPTSTRTAPANEEDFPQFLGPARNGIVRGPRLATGWSSNPPALLWRQPIGPAWSGFVIGGSRAFTQEQHGLEEQVTCYDLTHGKLLWTHSDEDRYANTISGEGPRATPTLSGNRIYALGANGRLNCLDAGTGNRLWTKSLTNEAVCTVPEWGFSGSPWVNDDRVVVSAGGSQGHSLMAFHARSGETLWAAGNSSAGYGSPFPATLSGIPQVLILNHQSLAAHNPRTGAVNWEVPFGTGFPLVANPIVVADDSVVVTAGYNVGAQRLQVGTGSNAPVSLWNSKKLKAKFSNPIAKDGFIYGLDDGILVCIDVRDGSQQWKEGRYGHGQGLLAGDLLILMSETGDLILLKPTPDGPNELGRLSVFHSKTWNPIALSGNRLLIRNDQEAAALLLPTAAD